MRFRSKLFTSRHFVVQQNTEIRDNNPVTALRRRYITWAVYGILILLIGILQTTPRLIPRIGDAHPLMPIPLTVMIAMFTGPAGGAAAGVASGFLWNLFDPDRLLGFHSLLLLVTGCAAGLLVKNLMRNNVMSALLLALPAILFVAGLDWVIHYVLMGDPDALYRLTRFALPDMAYTLTVSPLFYWLVRRIQRVLKK